MFTQEKHDIDCMEDVYDNATSDHREIRNEETVKVSHLCYRVDNIAVESLRIGMLPGGVCSLPRRKELLGEFEINGRCKLTIENIPASVQDLSVVEALSAAAYSLSIYDVGYNAFDINLYNKGQKKQHDSFQLEGYIQKQRDGIEALDNQIKELKYQKQVLNIEAPRNDLPTPDNFVSGQSSCFISNAGNDMLPETLHPCSTGVLLVITHQKSEDSVDALASLFIPLSDLTDMLMTMSADKTSGKHKNDQQMSNTQKLLRKLSRLKAVGTCQVEGLQLQSYEQGNTLSPFSLIDISIYLILQFSS